MTNTPAVSGGSAPLMRGLHNAQTKRHLAVALGLTFIGTVLFKYAYCEPRKQAYAEFYKNYDAQKSFERMRAKGHFQSC